MVIRARNSSSPPKAPVDPILLLCAAQGGTVEDDEAYAVTVTEGGDVVLAGYTRGDWTTQNLGHKDFAVVM